jgi:hypothetical protein
MRGALLGSWKPLGAWRAQLLFRAFGACWIVSNAIANSELPFSDMHARGVLELHGLTLGGLLLVTLGPRLVTLVPLALWSFACFGLLLSDTDRVFYFPAAEWTLWLALPIGALPPALLAVVREARGGDTHPGFDLDALVVGLFRIAAVATLGLAALHKLNVDFFDPSVSCIALQRRLADWWPLPRALVQQIRPGQIVASEALVALLLPLAPRVGLPAALVLMAPFTSIGAPGFGALVVSMALAFLPAGAVEPVALGLRRHARVVAPIVLGTVALSAALYRGTEFPWPPIGLAHGLGAFAACVVALALRAWPRSAGAAASAPGAGSKVYLGVFACALALNGLTPYLGLKFQYSFAMLSNLRVDDDRWNSWVFPRALRLTPHDPYVHVRRVRYEKMVGGERFDSGGPLDPALYSPDALRYGLKLALTRGVRVSLEADYQGRRLSFMDARDPGALYRWADELPAQPLFQKVLDQGRAQSCMH